MPWILLHLEQAEYDAVTRLAQQLKLKPEAVAYGGLNRVMLDSKRPETRAEIVDVWDAHRNNLPLWSDSACSVHAYEGKPDDEPEPSSHL